MTLTVLEFKFRPSRTMVGHISIQYFDLILSCQMAYLKKDDKLWIRMPEVWFQPTRKTKFVWWYGKEVSDAFQAEVFKQLENKFNFKPSIIKELYIKKYKKRSDKIETVAVS